MNKWPFVLGLAVLALSSISPSSTSAVNRISNAIATAEGFFVEGSRAQRNNNPGNLTSSFGFSTSGNDGLFVVFSTAADGWSALHQQVSMMLDGTSAFYRPSMSIEEIAGIYTETDRQAWAENVANYLGVPVNTPIGSV